MVELRWPPIIAAILAFLAACASFTMESMLLTDYRMHDFKEASTGDIVEEPDCVGYAKPSDVKNIYYNAKTNYYTPFGIGKYGGRDVACTNTEDRETLAKLVASSVHAIYYTYHQTTSPSDDLIAIYMAAVAAATGQQTSSLQWNMTIEGLQELDEPPTRCADIYTEPPEALTIEPYSTMEIICSEGDALAINAVNYEGKLHQHCLNQFHIGAFTDEHNGWTSGFYVSGLSGTMKLPIYGKLLQPSYQPWTDPVGFNSTMSYDNRARLLTGMRLGWSMFAVIPAFLLATFLIADSVFVLLVELTLMLRLRSVGAAVGGTGGRFSMTTQALMTVYATTQAMRAQRLTFVLIGWISVIVFRATFVWVPWSFGQILRRNKCKSGTGWQDDTDTVFYELTSLWLLFIAIIAIPLSKTKLLSINYRNAYKSQSEDVMATVAPGAQRTRIYVALVVLGFIVVMTLHTWVSIIMGESWAQAATHGIEDGSWNADSFANAVYAKILGALGITIASAIALASVLARWLFSGRSYCSCITLVIWFFIAGFAVVPLISYEQFTFDKDSFDEDCEHVKDGKNICEMRYWSHIIGLCIILVPLGIIVIFCILRNGFTLCMRRALGRVRMSGPLISTARRGVQKASMRNSGELVATTYEQDALLTPNLVKLVI